VASSVDAPYIAHRTAMGRTIAVVWWAASAYLFWDLVRRPDGKPAFVAGLFIVASWLIAYVWAWRPVLEERVQGLVVRNPLRDAWLPWRDLESILVEDLLSLEAGAVRVRCHAVPNVRPRQSLRPRMVERGPVPSYMPPEAPAPERSRGADVVAGRLRSMRDQAKASLAFDRQAKDVEEAWIRYSRLAVSLSVAALVLIIVGAGLLLF
jgi:hypothetical protein